MLQSTTVLMMALFAPVGQGGGPPFPPAPTFQRRVDYVAWFDAAVKKGVRDNAYPVYAEFLPELVGGTIAPDDWAKLSGMLTDGKWDEGPIPWAPAEHPEWEASHERARDVLEQFVAATKKKGLAAPSGLSPGVESSRNLMHKMTLAHPKYIGLCASASLEAAWRTDGDKADADALIDAFSTNLRAARQLEQGLTLLEHMTAHAIRGMTYRHVAWAFAHEVMDGNDAEKVGAMLRKIDGGVIDVRRGLRGEAAMLLDALQYVFGPFRGGGSSKLNAGRFGEVTGVTMGANRMAIGARLTTDAPGTAQAIVTMFKAFDRAMAPPYSTSREHDIQRAADQANRLNQVTRAMLLQHLWLPPYQSAMRTEAHRRATRVLVELYAHKASEGDWPKALSSLGKKTLRDIGDDPYSGKPFAYRIVEGKPLLYSVARDGKDGGGAHAQGWGYNMPGGDFVFWPIPDSAKLIARVKLKDVEEEKITRIADIDASLIGKEITVVAEIARASSRPSRRYTRRHSVVLRQGNATIELYYYEDLAKQLSAKQEIRAGATLRVIGVVRKAGSGFRLRLRDADHLVIEKSDG